MSNSSEDLGREAPAEELPRLEIASAHDLFSALRSDTLGVRLSVLSAICKAPRKALSYGPYDGHDLLDEMLAQIPKAPEKVHRWALVGAISAFDDPRVEEALKDIFRTSGDAREASMCTERLAISPAEARACFVTLQAEGSPPLQARFSANALARFEGYSPEERVRIAVLCDLPFSTPPLDDETERAWLEELERPSSHRARGLLESGGDLVFARLREKGDAFTPELKVWLLGWGGRANYAGTAELCVRALEEGPDEVRLAALRTVSGLGSAPDTLRHLVTRFLDHPDREMRLAALQAGAEVADPRGMLMNESDLEARLLLIPRLAAAYGADAVPDLVGLLHDESWEIRNTVTVALISLGGAAAEAVEKLMNHESIAVRAAAAQVLEGINP
jgi:hypothetical protein